MSYCRWSSDGFKCDVYVYEGDSWTTHVAGFRHRWTWVVRRFLLRRLRLRWLVRIPHWALFKRIPLPYVGHTFNDDSPLACALRLEWLRRLGYRVPQRAIDTLRREAQEQPE